MLLDVFHSAPATVPFQGPEGPEGSVWFLEPVSKLLGILKSNADSRAPYITTQSGSLGLELWHSQGASQFWPTDQDLFFRKETHRWEDWGSFSSPAVPQFAAPWEASEDQLGSGPVFEGVPTAGARHWRVFQKQSHWRSRRPLVHHVSRRWWRSINLCTWVCVLNQAYLVLGKHLCSDW